MSAVEKHEIHIYERSASNIEIYRCIHPDCRHYDRREFLIGKRAICCKCFQPFIIPKNQLKVGQRKPGRKQLVCFGCTKSPSANAFKEVIGTLEQIFKEEEDKEIKEILLGETTNASSNERV